MREKKAAGRGAFHRRRGSKTKHVSLPSDHMTEAQWKRRNGEVTTYQLGSPMKWETFRSMPNDLKEQYVRYLHEKYNITRAILAKAFGVSDTTLRNALSDCSLSDIFSAGSKMKQVEREQFYVFWNGQQHCDEDRFHEPATRRSDDPDIEPTGTPAAFAMQAFEFQFAGPYHADQLSNSLRRMIPEGTEVTLVVKCSMGSSIR